MLALIMFILSTKIFRIIRRFSLQDCVLERAML